MASRAKRLRLESQAIHQLGVRGRKTGVVLQDHGKRDEHGMQPLDSIFTPREVAQAPQDDDRADSGSPMEMASNDGPGPQTLLKNRQSVGRSIPRGRSPIKTRLNSPAKKNPYLDRLSSPSRSTLGDPDATVTRKLDFSAVSGKPKRPSTGTQLNGKTKSARTALRSSDEPYQEEVPEDHGTPMNSGAEGTHDPTMTDLVKQSMAMVDALRSDDVIEPEYGQGNDDTPSRNGLEVVPDNDNPPSVKVAPSPIKPSISAPAPKPQPSIPAIFGSRQRTLPDALDEDDDAEDLRREKRIRTSMPPPPRPTISTLTTARSRPEERPLKRGRGRPRKVERTQKRPPDEDEEPGDETFMEVQRAPPMPRSRGLVSLRSDTRNGGGTAAPSTRTDRNSAQLLDYWTRKSMEHADAQDARHVIRIPSSAHASSRAPRSRTRTNARTKVVDAVEEDEELEDWEVEEGVIVADCIAWEPRYEQKPPTDDEEVRLVEDRLAISADAIQTQVIPEATFRFAKTLTLPFMGAGVVDLPPEAVKRSKNSRKMHMVFFVHYGKVLVTINELHFRISAGGTWFVPRGNYYSITNDYEMPARIFFAQACEVSPLESSVEDDQS